MEHTKTPWMLTMGNHNAAIHEGVTIATITDESIEWQANAEFIVRAVNSHDELLHYLEMMVKWAEDTVVSMLKDEDVLPRGWEKALDAIAKAKGE